MRALCLSICVIALAACSQPAPPAPPAAPEPVQASPGELALAKFTGLSGRWAPNPEACSATNADKAGLIEIDVLTLKQGLDTCTVTKVVPQEGGEGVTVDAKCVTGAGAKKGEAYERPFTFISASRETLTWVTEGGAAEPFVRCQ